MADFDDVLDAHLDVMLEISDDLIQWRSNADENDTSVSILHAVEPGLEAHLEASRHPLGFALSPGSFRVGSFVGPADGVRICA